MANNGEDMCGRDGRPVISGAPGTDAEPSSSFSFEEAQAMALAFRDAREWGQFHNPKDLVLSISLEAAELLEVFQWSGTDLEVEAKRGHAAEELADVLIYCIYLADRMGVDIPGIVASKIRANEQRYPVDKARGSARKYGEL